MRGDEARVVDAFVAHLRRDGWSVETEVNWVDVVARRGEQVIFAEAKGRTAAPGLDVNTMYGQLLSRMPDDPVSGARYAVVVPDVLERFALRVPRRIRNLLQIDVYLVDAGGGVTLK